MPNYDFFCKETNTVFELNIPLSAHDVVKEGIDCPICNDGTLAEKVISSPGFKVRGGTPKFGPR